ncbi:MAG: hypothetical protein ACT4OO_06785 [Nitrospiraceae bacterium]
MPWLLWGLMMGMIMSGCASGGSTKNVGLTLQAPPGTPAGAAAHLAEGNRVYVAQDWAGAKAAYWSAIQAIPSFAEAHYNYALSLDQLGEKAEAKKHFMQAANLAPGNKIIWDSPPLRQIGLDYNLRNKTFLDSSPR